MILNRSTIGSTVRIRNGNRLEDFILVNDGEDVRHHVLSINSPAGKPLLNKQRFDLIMLPLPRHNHACIVMDVL